MRNILAITHKELYSFFFSPVMWVIFAVFLFLTGIMFYGPTMSFAKTYDVYMQHAANNPGSVDISLNLNASVIVPLMGNMSVILLFALPLLAMRLFSEEHSNGTMELLLTRPVSVFQLVIGKYLSVLIILFLLLLLTGVYPLILSIYGNFDFTPLISAYLAVFMTGAGFLSVGLLSSALSESQLIAAFLGFGGNLVLWIISWVSISFADDWKVVSTVFDFISFPGHLHQGIKGVLSSVDVIYFMSFIGFILFLTHRVISSLRWR